MAERKATPADGELILKLYDLRREPVMRQARADMIAKFHPKSWEEFSAVLKGDHPLNTAYRMVSSYWEMAAGLAKHGALHVGLLSENCGEGLILFAKAESYLAEIRAGNAPKAYVNMEWLLKNSREVRERLATIRKRLASMTK